MMEQQESENEVTNDGYRDDDDDDDNMEEDPGSQLAAGEIDEVMNVFEELESNELRVNDSDEQQALADENAGNNMYLSEQERGWALEIKATVEDPYSVLNLEYKAKPVSDYEYAQYALVSKGNLEEALSRMSNTQAFQRENRVDDSLEQGSAIIERSMDLVPGYLLNLSLCPETKGGLIVVDYAKCIHRYEQRPMTFKEDCMFHYYCLRATQPNLQAIREGLVGLAEANEAFGWQNISDARVYDYERRAHDEFWAHYPIIFRSIQFYNASFAATVLISSMKTFVSDRVAKSIRLDCQLDPQNDTRFGLFNGDPGPILTLPDLYLQPNPEEARTRVIQQCKELLAMRCENERSFRLSRS